tara:strand:+ start:1764 stop:2012 length:249 start_codon:yes stop_codon:yes gene_type:complete
MQSTDVMPLAAQNFSAANCKENGPALEVNVCAASFSVTENDTVSLADCAATRGSQATTGRHRKNMARASWLLQSALFLFFEE